MIWTWPWPRAKPGPRGPDPKERKPGASPDPALRRCRGARALAGLIRQASRMQCGDRKTCGQGSGLTAVFVRLATGNPADGRIFSGWCAPEKAFVPSGLTGFQGFADDVKKDLRT